MVGKKTKKEYERIEITFSKDNETEMELYNYILEQSKLLGKAKYLKVLAEEKMKSDKALK